MRAEKPEQVRCSGWGKSTEILNPFAVDSPDSAAMELALLILGLHTIDGDTLRVRETGEVIRILNIDTPETGSRARCESERIRAAAATTRTRALIGEASDVRILRSGETDIYGRTLATIRLDGEDLGARLIAEGHARRWRGRRESWCSPAEAGSGSGNRGSAARR